MGDRGPVPAAVLAAVRGQLSRMLRAQGSKIVLGDGGMSVLLVFGGSAGEGEHPTIAISRDHRTPVYLLDFNDEAYSIRQLDGARVTWMKGHPAGFLRTHGVTAPGYEPPLESPVVAIGVVEGVTLAQACEAVPRGRALFAACARGVRVRDVSGTLTIELSRALERRSFTVFHDRKDERFWCLIWESDAKPEECFAIGKPTGAYRPIDAVLGETTMDGILRVLDIPREVLLAA